MKINYLLLLVICGISRISSAQETKILTNCSIVVIGEKKPIPIDDGFKIFSQLEGIYLKSTNPSETYMKPALLAKQSLSLFPEIEKDDTKVIQVDFINLIPHLIETIKVLEKENKMLKMRIDLIEKHQHQEIELLQTRLRIIENKLRSRKVKDGAKTRG